MILASSVMVKNEFVNKSLNALVITCCSVSDCTSVSNQFSD